MNNFKKEKKRITKLALEKVESLFEMDSYYQTPHLESLHRLVSKLVRQEFDVNPNNIKKLFKKSMKASRAKFNGTNDDSEYSDIFCVINGEKSSRTHFSMNEVLEYGTQKLINDIVEYICKNYSINIHGKTSN